MATNTKQSVSMKVSPSKKQVNKVNSIEKIQLKLDTVFQEGHDNISSHLRQYNQIASELEQGYTKAHEEYIVKLNKINKIRSVKVSELNDKYDYDLNKVKEYHNCNTNDCVNNKIYYFILQDKRLELKQIDDEFNELISNLKNEYNEQITLINKTANVNKDTINQIDYLKEIKAKINDCVQKSFETKNNKKEVSESISKFEGKSTKAKNK